MVSHRAINDIMQTPKKEVHFFFFSVCCIVFNCSWQLIIFDKKQKLCVKRIHLVTDDGLYDRKAFYTVKIVCLFILYEWWWIYQLFHYFISLETASAQKREVFLLRISSEIVNASFATCRYSEIYNFSFRKEFLETLRKCIYLGF